MDVIMKSSVKKNKKRHMGVLELMQLLIWLLKWSVREGLTQITFSCHVEF